MGYFNPHEREARDETVPAHGRCAKNFNPHEREARDRRATSAHRNRS